MPYSDIVHLLKRIYSVTLLQSTYKVPEKMNHKLFEPLILKYFEIWPMTSPYDSLFCQITGCLKTWTFFKLL